MWTFRRSRRGWRSSAATRASCATCHPKMSNCGLDVEKMDTTFKIRTSAHNIHSVKCLDCHEKYEREADALKAELGRESGVPPHGLRGELPRVDNGAK